MLGNFSRALDLGTELVAKNASLCSLIFIDSGIRDTNSQINEDHIIDCLAIFFQLCPWLQNIFFMPDEKRAFFLDSLGDVADDFEQHGRKNRLSWSPWTFFVV